MALALDTVDAVLRTPGVLECVIVGEPATCDAFADSGGRCVTTGTDRGVNEAFSAGAAASHPTAGGVCLLVADLPLLEPTDLGAALAGVPELGPAVVRDREGVGTVLLASRGRVVKPAFGPGSAARHAASGAHDLTGVVSPALRTDLDVWKDLVGLSPRRGSRLEAWFRSDGAADRRGARLRPDRERCDTPAT